MQHVRRRFAAYVLFALVGSASAGTPVLVGVEEDTGDFYAISTSDASIQLIGQSGIQNLGALEFNPSDGSYYGFTTGAQAALYRFEIPASLDSVTPSLVGSLGLGFVFEGALAFGPDGTAYAMNGGVTLPALLTLNLGTGQATVVNVMADRHDIAGLGWRSDGALVGLDSTANGLLTINPANAGVALIDDITPHIGAVGGMALLDEIGYFVTGGPLAVNPDPGSNELYSFNPATGEHFLIGSFEDLILGSGFSGLSVVPEPATLGVLLLAGLGLVRRRARARSH